MKSKFLVTATNAAALFSLKLYRGDGMTLLAMNWKKGEPPQNFVGFAIEYKEPIADKYYVLRNRLCFPKSDGSLNPNILSTLLSPIQKFRWVHFPRNADLPGEFVYRVTPVFMNERDELNYGLAQTAGIELRRETYPGVLNISFTRGFVSSQAFVDNFEKAGSISKLLPRTAKDGLSFKPTHPKTTEALTWMGFEARSEILELLDNAVADKNAKVYVIAYDLNEPEMLSRLERIGKRLRIIIDDDGAHGEEGSAENAAEKRLVQTAGRDNVKRQHMGQLQHNKTIVVDGKKVKAAVCGSTNFSWRGFYVQSNNALVLKGGKAIKPFIDAFNHYWDNENTKDFSNTSSAGWIKLDLPQINAKITFSPHSDNNAVLETIADDVEENTSSSLLYSLAFLHQTPGPMLEAIKKVTSSKKIFVYGVSDKKTGGLDVQIPDGNIAPVFPSALGNETLPEPFKSEPAGGSGTRMHHKFLVVDFNKPSARVYLGSYNFSNAADRKNGDNVLLIKDRGVAVSYMIEALRIFDHYHFRVAQSAAKKKRERLALAKPPRKPGEKPWWFKYYTDKQRIRDRELFG